MEEEEAVALIGRRQSLRHDGLKTTTTTTMTTSSPTSNSIRFTDEEFSDLRDTTKIDVKMSNLQGGGSGPSSVIVRPPKNSDQEAAAAAAAEAEEEKVREVYLEEVIEKKACQEFYCPNCNTCITKVILRDSGGSGDGFQTREIHEDETVHVVDAFRCTSCFSFLIPAGNWFFPNFLRSEEDDTNDRARETNVLLDPRRDSNKAPSTGTSHDQRSHAPLMAEAYPSSLQTVRVGLTVKQDPAQTGEVVIDGGINLVGALEEKNADPPRTSSTNQVSSVGTPRDLYKAPSRQILNDQSSPPSAINKDPSPPDTDGVGITIGTIEPLKAGKGDIAYTKRDPTQSKDASDRVKNLVVALEEQNAGTPHDFSPNKVLFRVMSLDQNKAAPSSGTLRDQDGPTSVINEDPLAVETIRVDPASRSAEKQEADRGYAAYPKRYPIQLEEPVTEGRVNSVGALEETIQVEAELPESSLTSINIIESSDATISESRTASRLEILKSIVYGGLVESITSLSVVTSAASAGAATLNIIALALANLIGGIFVICHKLWELKTEQVSEPFNQTNEQASRYRKLLGHRQNFMFHATIVLVSFIFFGSIPPLIYGFSFPESNSRDLKLAAVAAASLICIIVLAVGKAHVLRPTSYYIYVKTVAYYVVVVVMASGVSYIAGDLIAKLIEKLGWFKSEVALNLPLDDLSSMKYTWTSS